jgi:hypothetical protein
MEWFGVVGYTTNSATGANFNQEHYGFRIVREDSGSTLIYATNSNNTTQTSTDITSTVSFSTIKGYILKAVYDNSEIKFYVNGVLGATHTTNLPGVSGSGVMFHTGLNNLNVASDSRVTVSFMQYMQKII